MKTGSLVVTALVVGGLLVVGHHIFLPVGSSEQGIQTSGWLIFLSIGIGVLFSIWLLNLAIEALIAGRPINYWGLATSARKGSRIGAYLLAICSYPFALFLGFVVGGNLGGSIGGNVTHSIGLGKAGIPIGIGIGLSVVTTLVCLVAAHIGFVLGGGLERFVRLLRME